ncbi:hypothetical protein ACWEN4_36935 [Streptomyces violaceorubidus]
MTKSDTAALLHSGRGARGLLHALPLGYENDSGHWTRSPALCGALVEMPPVPAQVRFGFGWSVAMWQRSGHLRTYGSHRPLADFHSRRLRRLAHTRSIDTHVCRKCRKEIHRMTHPRWTGNLKPSAA